MAHVWTAFVHGQEPWELYPKSHRFMRFGPVRETVMDDVKNDAMREYGYLGRCRNH
jgi:hypothetical protein